jgi:hypothetical protein
VVLHFEMSEAKETPWGTFKRLEAANESFDAIVTALRARGLSPHEIEVLLSNEPGFQEWSTQLAEKKSRLEVEFRERALPLFIGPSLRWGLMTINSLIVLFPAANTYFPFGWVALASLLGLAAYELIRSARQAALRLSFAFVYAFFIAATFSALAGYTLGRASVALMLGTSLPLFLFGSTAVEKIKGLEDFGTKGKVFEDGDVQFVVRWENELRDKYAPGHHVNLLLTAQNCVEVPRSLVVAVRGDSQVGFRAQNHVLPISPGCIIEAIIPVRVPPMATEQFSFRLDFVGAGKVSGRRVRIAKGAPWVKAKAFATNVFMRLLRWKAASTATKAEFPGVSPVREDMVVSLTDKAGSESVRPDKKQDGTVVVHVAGDQPSDQEEQQVQVREVYRPAEALLSAAART